MCTVVPRTGEVWLYVKEATTITLFAMVPITAGVVVASRSVPASLRLASYRLDSLCEKSLLPCCRRFQVGPITLSKNPQELICIPSCRWVPGPPKVTKHMVHISLVLGIRAMILGTLDML